VHVIAIAQPLKVSEKVANHLGLDSTVAC